MMMINSCPSSSTTGTDSSKRLRLTIPRNNKTDLLNNSNTISPTKLDEKTIHPQKKSIDCNNTMSTMKQQLSSPIDNENDTTLLTTTTTTTTVEVKVKTTKTSSSSSSRKRKLNSMDESINTPDDNSNKQEEQQQQQSISKKKKKARATNNDSIIDADSSNNDTNDHHPTSPKTVDQSSVTDESAFGSCEPGTSVVLQGIVWNETDKGVLVVNITWRGKTYVGALLNTTEQNWAPPRYKSDTRSSKHNRHNHHHNATRDYLLTPTTSSASSTHHHHQSNTTHSSHEPAERILRNGKRRGPCTTVTPTAASKSDSFKIPEAPPSKTDENLINNDKLLDSGNGAPSSSSTSVNDEDETNSISGEKTLGRNGVDDEPGDNCSSRSVSPTTSGGSTTSSSPPPSIQEKSIVQSEVSASVPMTNGHSSEPVLPASIPMDLSNTRTTTIKIEENTSFNSIVQRPSPSKPFSSPNSSPLPSSFLSSFSNKSSKSKSKDSLQTPPSLLSAHPFSNPLLFSSPPNPGNYFPMPPGAPFLHGPNNAFGLSTFHPLHPQTSSLHNHSNKTKLSPTSSSSPSTVSPSSYLSLPPQLYFNPLTAPRYPSPCSAASPSSLGKSSR